MLIELISGGSQHTILALSPFSSMASALINSPCKALDRLMIKVGYKPCCINVVAEASVFERNQYIGNLTIQEMIKAD